MRAKAKKREATALASSGGGGKVCPPNECSVAEGGAKVDVPVQVLVHVVAYIIPIMDREASLHWRGGHAQRGTRTAGVSSTWPSASSPAFSSSLVISWAVGRQSCSM